MTLDEFITTCKELGLLTHLDYSIKDGEIKHSCYAYYKSDILEAEGHYHQTIFTWSDEFLSGNSIYEGYMEALWHDFYKGKEFYILNGTDLGDCDNPLTSKEQMLKIGKSFIAAVKKLEEDPNFRPECIELTENGFTVYRE